MKCEVEGGGENLKKFLKKVKEQKVRLDAGFFEDATYPDGQKIAAVAMWNEFGTVSSKGNQMIPPRSFMQSSFDENKNKWFKYLGNEIKKQKKDIDVFYILKSLGVLVQNDIRGKIDEWARELTPRNAEATIDVKGYDSPLIWKGDMQNAVSFSVVKK